MFLTVTTSTLKGDSVLKKQVKALTCNVKVYPKAARYDKDRLQDKKHDLSCLVYLIARFPLSFHFHVNAPTITADCRIFVFTINYFEISAINQQLESCIKSPTLCLEGSIGLFYPCSSLMRLSQGGANTSGDGCVQKIKEKRLVL